MSSGDPQRAARDQVRACYAEAGGQALAGERPSCADADPAGMCSDGYDPDQLADSPAGAGAASLGCGNPLAVAGIARVLRPGGRLGAADLVTDDGADPAVAAAGAASVGAITGTLTVGHHRDELGAAGLVVQARRAGR